MAIASSASLKPLLEPSSVAVIGASRDPSSIGHRILTLFAAKYPHLARDERAA